MPFNNIGDITGSRDDFVKKVKAEFKIQLKDRTIADFWYFDGLPPGDETGQVFVFGRMQAGDLKTLKAASSAQALGECMLDGKTLKIVLRRGKIKLPRFKKMMKEIGAAYSAELLDSFGPNPALSGIAADDGDPALAQVTRLIDLAWEALREVEPRLEAADAKALRALLAPLVKEATTKAPDLQKAMRVNAAFEKKLGELKAGLGEGPKKIDSRAEAGVKLKWDAVMNRFDRVKALLTDEERTALRKRWGRAETLREKGGFEAASKELDELDKEMKVFAKAALADQKTRAAAAKDGLEKGKAPETPETKALAALVAKKLEWVRKAEATVKTERAGLEKLRFALLKARDASVAARLKAEEAGEADPKLALDTALIDKLQKAFAAAGKRVETAREAAAGQMKQLDHLKREYEKKAGKPDPRLSQVFEVASSRIGKLESLIEELPFTEAGAALKDTVKEMAEATAWREERIKAESTGTAGHATGRHGAQTGMERQARRAATSESYLDTSGNTPRVKTRGGVTPDQAGNAAGTAQQSTTWNGIDITWAEMDGKRVIANRTKTVKSLLSGPPQPTTTGASLAGSMWATPVLEKRAFDAVSGVAAKLKSYTQYQKANGSWGDFKQLNVSLGPAKSGGAGWGYAVRKTGKKGSALTESQANAILDKFEKGSISLDELFKQMSVAMVQDASGKNMIQGVTAIFRRQNVAGDFKMVTQYPNDSISADGWKPFDSASGSMTFRDAGGTTAVENLATLPA